MILEVLPTRTGSAAENMALDFLLLRAGVARFRHYGWRGPAFTFGYAQKSAFVRAQLASEGQLDLCRRPTGGGLVDHRDDWTFALVIPRGHPLEDVRATTSYREVHEALASALRAQGVPAASKTVPPEADGMGVCFQRAELFDVVNTETGNKIAGAAQKRNKHGLLFQGSVWRPAAGGAAVDWEKFRDDFAAAIAGVMQVAAVETPWPELNEDEVSGLTEQYAAPEWNEAR